MVIYETMQMLNNDELVEQMVEAMFELNTQRSTTLPLLEQQQKSIDNMLNAIQAGISNESTKQRLDELEQSKKDTEVAILQESMLNA